MEGGASPRAGPWRYKGVRKAAASSVLGRVFRFYKGPLGSSVEMGGSPPHTSYRCTATWTPKPISFP